jgi:hypothetical protein
MMRKLMIGVLLVMMVLVTGVSMAQQQEVFCGTLSSADCDLLTRSTETMNAVTSSTFTLDLTVDAGSQGTLNLSANGVFNGDFSAFSQEDMAALSSSNPADSIDAIVKALQAFSGSLNLTISGSPQVGLPGNVELELVLVNGVGYLNFKKLAALAGADGDSMLMAFGITDWAGIDFVDVFNQFGPMLAAQGEMNVTTPDQTALVESFSSYLTITRSADVNGEAVFTTNVDLAGLLSDPAFSELIEAQGGEMSGADAEEAMKMLANSTFTATTTIDLETLYQTSTTFEISFTTPEGPFSLTGSTTMDNFNSAPTVTAPAGPVASAMDLMQLGSMMGGF